MIYSTRYVLSWNKGYILLLLGGVFYLCQLDPLVNFVVQIFYILADFLSACPCPLSLKATQYDYRLFYLSCQFLLSTFGAMLLDIYKFRIVITSSCNDLFIYTKRPYLSLRMSLPLKSTLSGISGPPPAYRGWYIYSVTFPFFNFQRLCVLLFKEYLSLVAYRFLKFSMTISFNWSI